MAESLLKKYFVFCLLTWEKHIENICLIVNSRLSLLRRSNRFSIITVLYVSSTLVFITSLSIVRVHGVIVPIIYCLVFFSFKNVQLHSSLMPTSLNHLYVNGKRGVKWLLRDTWLSVFNFRERWKYEIKTRELWLVCLPWYVNFKIFYPIFMIFS